MVMLAVSLGLMALLVATAGGTPAAHHGEASHAPARAPLSDAAATGAYPLQPSPAGTTTSTAAVTTTTAHHHDVRLEPPSTGAPPLAWHGRRGAAHAPLVTTTTLPPATTTTAVTTPLVPADRTQTRDT